MPYGFSFVRYKSFLLVFVMLLTFFPSALAADKTGVTNAKVVLRKSTSVESKALQTLSKGEEVAILGTSGSWYRIRYGSYTGYMMKKYVDVSVRSGIDSLGAAPGIMRVGDQNSDVKKLQQALFCFCFHSWFSYTPFIRRLSPCYRQQGISPQDNLCGTKL